MFQSKNCGHGFDLYVKRSIAARRVMEQPQLRDLLEDMTGETYAIFIPTYCPICGKKVEREENDS